MTRINIALFFLLVVLANTAVNAQHVSRVLFDNDWRFKLDSVNNYSGAAINDGSWRKLNLPHDWSIEGKFSKDNPATAGGGALPGGIGWYRKNFTVPARAQEKTVLITFDGFYRFNMI